MSRLLLPALISWALIAGLSLMGGLNGALSLAYSGPDDAMRFLQIRDWMDGHAWHDLTQARLGAEGLAFHWSRWPDPPIFALAQFLKLLMPADAALAWAAALWPPLLLAAPLALIALMAGRYGGLAAAIFACLLTATAFRALAQFGPGQIDHHNLQMTLAVTLMFGAVMSRRHEAWAVLAGLAGALTIGIGLEGAPYAVAAAAVLGLFALDGARGSTRAISLFGLTLSAGMVLVYARSGVWLTPYAQSCVAFSREFLTAGLLLGAGCAACGIAFMRLSSRTTRLAAGLVIGAASAGLFLILHPDCPAMAWSPEGRNLAASPQDAALAALWLGGVQETMNAWEILRMDYRAALATYAAPGLALPGAIWLWRAEPKMRDLALAAGVFLAIAFALSLFQNRAAMFSQLLAAPIAGAVLAALWSRWRAGDDGARAGLLAAALGLNGLTYLVVFATAPEPASASEPLRQAQAHAACVQPEAMETLSALPPGRVVAPLHLGPAILLHTGHRVWAAPYSTNLEGTLTAYRILAAPPEAAMSGLEAAGADFLALCPGAKEDVRFQRAYPEGLAARLSQGGAVEGVQLITGPDAPVRIYRITPGDVR